jgi:serine/threonine-protein kinase RsbW
MTAAARTDDHPATGPRWRSAVTADCAQLAPLRARLGEWLTRCGAEEARREAVLLAVTEAVTNSIEHGYAERSDGLVECQCVLLRSRNLRRRSRQARPATRLRITVRDWGRWRPPTTAKPSAGPSVTGRGLLLIEALARQANVRGGADGTVLTATFAL